jgi:hypothetical protein
VNFSKAAMKRLGDALSPPTAAVTTFFALSESAGMLLDSCGGFAAPLLVATLIQLCCEARRAVFRWLANPQQCRPPWVNDFLRGLAACVPAASLTPPFVSRGGMDWPVFFVPCRHMNAERGFYLGTCGASAWLGGDEDATEGEWYDCDQMVAIEYHKDAHWQPACCANMTTFHWRYVALALRHRHDRRIVEEHRRWEKRSYKKCYSYFFIQ